MTLDIPYLRDMIKKATRPNDSSMLVAQAAWAAYLTEALDEIERLTSLGPRDEIDEGPFSPYESVSKLTSHSHGDSWAGFHRTSDIRPEDC